MTTSYTLTGDFGNLIGEEARGVKATIGTNLGTAALVDLDSSEVLFAGPDRIGLNADGTFSLPLIATDSTGTNVTDGSLRYIVYGTYRDGNNTERRWDSGYFTLTADADLSAKVGAEYLPPSFASETIAQMEAIRDETEEISGLSGEDAAVAFLQGDDGSLTAGATDARIETKVAADVASPATAIGAALTAEFAPGGAAGNVDETLGDGRWRQKADELRNILDYGVERGTAASQTAAILAALAAHPGEPFYFPPGDYRCDAPLLVADGNPLIIDGRIYAGAAMDTLLDWDNGAATASGYAQDAYIGGRGTLDANLLADTALAVGSVIRFPIEGLTIVNPIHRGLVTKALGAEVFARNLRFHNTGTSNVTDNVAIEANMGDCHFLHIVTRDFTIGIWDKNGNRWIDVHPWLGDSTQLAARYPTSVGFKLAKNSLLISPYVDTYRYGYQGTGTYDTVRIIAPEFLTNTGNLSGGLAAANLGAVFDLGSTGHRFNVVDGTYNGHPSAPIPLATGNTRRFFHQRGVIRNDVSGGGDYAWGVKLGTVQFTPTIEGSTGVGAQVHTTQEGYMEIRGISPNAAYGIAYYHFRVAATIEAGATGNLRIGGLPYPVGASAIRAGIGNIARVTGGVDATGVISGASAPAGPPWVGTTQRLTLQKAAAGATSEVPVPAAGTALEFWGEVAIPIVLATS